jgi:hypothetical protein
MSFTSEEIGLQLEALQGELWKRVDGTSETYYISNMGRLLSTNWKGSGRQAIMKPAKDAHGYYRTMLKYGDRFKTIKVHRIVAQHWIPNTEQKPMVNHINFDRADNRVANLEWVTNEENMAHSHKAGNFHRYKGSQIGTSKLTEAQVAEIREKFKLKEHTRKTLGAEYGVSPATIKDAILRRWKHVK